MISKMTACVWAPAVILAEAQFRLGWADTVLYVSECVSVCREHNHSAEDEEIYQDWVKTMEPIYNNINNFTRVRF